MAISFNIVIPNYNNSVWLDKTFSSIFNQTYGNYNIIFVDDCSTDSSVDVATKWRDEFDEKLPIVDFDILVNMEKRWNGGSRNAARESYLWKAAPYTLFMDSDDWFADETCLEETARIIESNNRPDLVRLSYYSLIGEQLGLCDLGAQNTIETIVSDCNVACWTKCVKTEKLVPFPENTLMEDVVQHIKQMDVIDTAVATSKGIIVWNRNNSNSCSRDDSLQDGKWKSSFYRYVADLMDTKVTRPECRAELERRIALALDNAHHDRYIQ